MNNAIPPATVAPRITPPLAVALLALVVLAGALGWFLGHRSAATTAALASLPADAKQPVAGTAPQELHDSAISPVAMSPASPRDARTNGQTSLPMLGLDAASIARLKQQQAQRQRALEANFARDPRDPNAGQVELAMLKSMVDPVLTSDGIAPGNPEVECHRGNCRISADFNSADDASSWAVNYLTMLGVQLGASQPVFKSNPDGSVRMQLYGTRR